ncbi:MAG: hypothetical protein ABEJ25_00485, partial [Candidatus Bipolaricaulia bacterium]
KNPPSNAYNANSAPASACRARKESLFTSTAIEALARTTVGFGNKSRMIRLPARHKALLKKEPGHRPRLRVVNSVGQY